jgi:aspartate/tyrosine/aromatic aminotransferase
MASLFGHVEPAAKDPILGVTEAFLADPSPDKVNVGVVRLSLSLSPACPAVSCPVPAAC